MKSLNNQTLSGFICCSWKGVCTFVLVFCLLRVFSWSGAYYTHPLSYPENQFLDTILKKLEQRVDQGVTHRGTLEQQIAPRTDEFNETERDEFLELLHDEIILRAKYPMLGYAKALLPTPVMSSPDFATTWGGSTVRSGGYGLNIDQREMIHGLVAVALPDTVFTVAYQLENQGNTIYAVYTRDLMPPPNSKVRFVDARFLDLLNDKPPDRAVTLPGFEEVVQRLRAAEGKRYVRGGTYAAGVPEMGVRYPYPEDIPDHLRQLRTLEGVDCSGLLYQATNGRTPRNTLLLLDIGFSVPIEGKTVDEIVESLKPLDLIVRRGHAIIVLNKNYVIESRHDYDLQTPGPQGGVRIRSTRAVLNEIRKQRFPVDDYRGSTHLSDTKKFVIRRRRNSELAK